MLGRAHGWRARALLLSPRPPLVRHRRGTARGLASSSGQADERASDNGGRPLTPKELGPYLSDNLSRFSPDSIRNFSIVAHIDHGKSVRLSLSLYFSLSCSKVGCIARRRTTDGWSASLADAGRPAARGERQHHAARARERAAPRQPQGASPMCFSCIDDSDC